MMPIVCVNVTKTKSVLFRSTVCIKFMGVIIQTNMSWEAHNISYIADIIAKKQRQFYLDYT